MIYTITLIKTIKDNFETNLPEFEDRRCIGYYFSIDEARMAINNISNEQYYEYCIIEAIPQGCYKYSPNRYLFKWYNNRFMQIDEPKSLHYVTNFAIG